MNYDIRTLHAAPAYRAFRRRVAHNMIGALVALTLAAMLITAAVTEAHIAGLDSPGLGAQCGIGLACVLWAAWHLTRLDSLLDDDGSAPR